VKNQTFDYPGIIPAEEPLSYPGVLPEYSYLLLNQHIVPLVARKNRRLPKWRVIADDETIPGDEDETGALPLDYVLLRNNEPPMLNRVPVIAVGSNASPAQLWHKFQKASISPIMPLTLAVVTGVGIGVCAYISKNGYLPSTAILDSKAKSKLFVLWMSKEQLDVIDKTEGGYHRVKLEKPHCEVFLESGEVLENCYVYLSKTGYLLDENGEPILFPDVEHLALHDNFQATLIERVFSTIPELSSELNNGIELLVGQVRTDNAVRTRITNSLKGSGRVEQPQSHSALIAAAGGDAEHSARPSAIIYDEIPTAFLGDVPGLRVRATRSDFKREGESSVVVSPLFRGQLGTSHALISNANELEPSGVQILARVLEDSAIDDAEIRADQIVRTAVGVDIGENIILTPAKTYKAISPRLLFGNPHYVICRVQPADLSTIEREVCLLDELTLMLSGIESGDEVIIEGSVDNCSDVLSVKMNALRTPSETRERRESLHGGGYASRFPSSLDALGVWPDLPWIFLDRDAREILGLRNGKLATVRVRASRGFQLRKEFRELLFVLGLTLIGLVSIISSGLGQVAVLLVFVVLIVTTVIFRMRSNLRLSMHQIR